MTPFPTDPPIASNVAIQDLTPGLPCGLPMLQYKT